jgi:hypothetical protein
MANSVFIGYRDGDGDGGGVALDGSVEGTEC